VPTSDFGLKMKESRPYPCQFSAPESSDLPEGPHQNNDTSFQKQFALPSRMIARRQGQMPGCPHPFERLVRLTHDCLCLDDTYCHMYKCYNTKSRIETAQMIMMSAQAPASG
jgi:hypothetical protein